MTFRNNSRQYPFSPWQPLSIRNLPFISPLNHRRVSFARYATDSQTHARSTGDEVVGDAVSQRHPESTFLPFTTERDRYLYSSRPTLETPRKSSTQRSLRSEHQTPHKMLSSLTPTRTLRSDYTPSPSNRIEQPGSSLDPLVPRNSGSRRRAPPKQLRRTRSRTTSQTFLVCTPDRSLTQKDVDGDGRPSYHDPISRLNTPSRSSPDIKYTPLFAVPPPTESTGCSITEPAGVTFRSNSYRSNSTHPDLAGEATIWTANFPLKPFDNNTVTSMSSISTATIPNDGTGIGMGMGIGMAYPRAVTPQDILLHAATGISYESPLFYHDPLVTQLRDPFLTPLPPPHSPVEGISTPPSIHNGSGLGSDYPGGLVYDHNPNSNDNFVNMQTSLDLNPGLGERGKEVEPEPELDLYFCFSPLVKDTETFGSTPVGAYFQAAATEATKRSEDGLEGQLGGGKDAEMGWESEVGMGLSSAGGGTDMEMEMEMEVVCVSPGQGQGGEDLLGRNCRTAEEGADGSREKQDGKKDQVGDVRALPAEPTEEPETDSALLKTHPNVDPKSRIDTSTIVGLVDYPSPTPSPTFAQGTTAAHIHGRVSTSPIPEGKATDEQMKPEPYALAFAPARAEQAVIPEVIVGTTVSESIEQEEGSEVKIIVEPNAIQANLEGKPKGSCPGDDARDDSPLQGDPMEVDNEPGPRTAKVTTFKPTIHQLLGASGPTSDEELRAMIMKVPDKRYPSRRWPSATPSQSSSSSHRRPGTSFSATKSNSRTKDTTDPHSPPLRTQAKRKRRPQPLQLRTPSRNPNAKPLVVKPHIHELLNEADEKEIDMQDVSDAESELTPLPEEVS